jgi:phage baseplate assembly protein W
MAFQPLIIDGDLNNVSDNSGYHLISDIRTNIKQNLKMLVLTSPGERVMDPNFGVGIKRFLFEMVDNEVFSRIDSKIRDQVKIYIPYVSINRVRFQEYPDKPNAIKLSIEYSVPRLSLNDVLAVLL